MARGFYGNEFVQVSSSNVKSSNQKSKVKSSKSKVQSQKFKLKILLKCSTLTHDIFAIEIHIQYNGHFQK